MSTLFAVIKKLWKPLAEILLVAFLLCAAAYWCYSRGYQEADSSWKLQWAQRDLTDATTTLQREVTERAEEQRRQRAVNEEREKADEELAKVQADADAAKRARGGLQQQLAEIQRQLATSETGRISAIAAASQAKSEVASLLAELLGEADAMAGEFAKEADERYVAGSTCERTYDKITVKK
ncbi:DUF2514 domain-containing protein [Salmonella enterica]|uniref:Phage-tail assembly protein n=1 Tax=Salmonella enterica subsp. enterica serovar Senftenberg str. A4-543 TaxID=913082 RepID=G5QY76_SALSE|nr:DUF2514 domain-containing protein [Salmonella enterica]EBK1501104.1 DUF2514 domain-containing protein [Salmonella enterica subsp. enterica serovar Give]EED3885127.1 DUF2514 domain-containing protein [Salmonella enterica subsp. enterica serovar Tennessee]EEG4796493.1 DUF2514 domain-containing protein [Salmonella enterica subsp. enterica]EHC90793.1 phage-tail assembly protein [Salmonella enterica subsp. enterica serovar Senftenberg str. A4-543]